ncbi:MAG: hypothetical protein OXE50_13245 [Chloroflexi bacterium]|nr:hypothetical protein [Chloroflexota bacterium]
MVARATPRPLVLLTLTQVLLLQLLVHGLPASRVPLRRVALALQLGCDALPPPHRLLQLVRPGPGAEQQLLIAQILRAVHPHVHAASLTQHLDLAVPDPAVQRRERYPSSRAAISFDTHLTGSSIASPSPSTDPEP